LLHIGNLVGTFAVMYYKDRVGRSRPSQVLPALLPSIAVPGHASYPSGHSTQAHLIAACVALALPGPTAGVPNPTTVALAGTPNNPGALSVLAHRIARNREIAGLHFPSDSGAGVELAAYCFNLLQGPQSFKDVVSAAQKEWQ
jgi:membrane-associated phospholipid phosphatase